MVYNLDQRGFSVVGLCDAAEFYKAHALVHCDVAVIDIGLPGEDGLSIASHLRASGPVGIVFATARGALNDRLSGMQSGGDAYFVKPINIEELAATLRALGRRVRDAAVPVAPIEPGVWHLSEGDWVLNDPVGRKLTLTTAERAFLGCLFRQQGKAVSRELILRELGGDWLESVPQRVDTIAFRLRRKAEHSHMSLPLHTVRGQGYLLAK
jgi:DNA-binding response OmpR family regulator